MKRIHSAIQVAIVLTVTAFVSWPSFRPDGAQPAWRSAPDASQQTQTDEAARVDRDPSSAAIVGLGRSSTRSVAQATTRPETARPSAGGPAAFNTPSAVAALGGTLDALVGVAQTSTYKPIPYARLLLRSVLSGVVDARATANDEGRFSFLDVEPDTYVVELRGTAGSVIATSAVVTVASGDVRQTAVRTIAAAPDVAASFGNALTGTLAQATSLAAGNDVTRTAEGLTPEASPNSPTGGGR